MPSRRQWRWPGHTRTAVADQMGGRYRAARLTLAGNDETDEHSHAICQ